MFELQNFTCFHTQQFKNIDQTDRAYDVVVAKVSYEFEIDPEKRSLRLPVSKRRSRLPIPITAIPRKPQLSLKATSASTSPKPTWSSMPPPMHPTTFPLGNLPYP